MVPLKIKLIEGGKAPTCATEFSAGLDLYASIRPEMNGQYNGLITIRPGENMVIPVGFCMEVPPGHEGQIRPRSGMAKDGVVAAFGTIDSDYRGELSVNLFNHSWKHFSVNNGMRIGQLVISKLQDVEVTECVNLSVTDRGPRGFGSSGQ